MGEAYQQSHRELPLTLVAISKLARLAAHLVIWQGSWEHQGVLVFTPAHELQDQTSMLILLLSIKTVICSHSPTKILTYCTFKAYIWHCDVINHAHRPAFQIFNQWGENLISAHTRLYRIKWQQTQTGNETRGMTKTKGEARQLFWPWRPYVKLNQRANITDFCHGIQFCGIIWNVM